jgi:hypothetical protein
MDEARRRAKENEAWLLRLVAELRRQDRELAELAALAGATPADPPVPAPSPVRPGIGFVRA